SSGEIAEDSSSESDSSGEVIEDSSSESDSSGEVAEDSSSESDSSSEIAEDSSSEITCEHDYKSVTVKSTYLTKGYTENKCSVCGDVEYIKYDELLTMSAPKSTVTSNSVKLTWDKVSEAKGYEIYQNGKKIKTVSGTSYTVTNLKPNTSYKFAVKPYKQSDTETIYGNTSKTLTALTRPSAVKFKLTAAARTVTVKWDKVTGADGYIIYRYNDSGKTWSRAAKVSSKITSYTVSKLQPGKAYKFTVKAYRTVNGKELAGSDYSALQAITLPDTVSGLKTSLTTKSVKLSWNKAGGAKGYCIYQYKGNKWVRIKTLSSTSYTVSNLKSGTTYKFLVKSYTKSGNSVIYGSNSKSITVSTYPASVNLKLTAGSGKVTLKWNKVTGAQGYDVYFYPPGSSSWKLIKSTRGTSYTKTGLAKGKVYYFYVQPYRTVGNIKYYGSAITKSVKVR
ncbi:MAG: fibronectin type III domain-containing protein, partial [Oscillospiraceae bacterium]